MFYKLYKEGEGIYLQFMGCKLLLNFCSVLKLVSDFVIQCKCIKKTVIYKKKNQRISSLTKSLVQIYRNNSSLFYPKKGKC